MKAIPFDADWRFCEYAGEKYACLPKDDVKKLRQILIENRCEGQP